MIIKMTDKNRKQNSEQKTDNIDVVSNGVADAQKDLGNILPPGETEITQVISSVLNEKVQETPAKPRDDRDKRKKEKGSRGGRRKFSREDRPKSEFDHRLIALRRVARVVAGGRRFSFSAVVTVGNRKGGVGIGQGKAADTPLATEKAVRDAKKHMITVELAKNMRIPHQTQSKDSTAIVKIMPAPGRGILAGSAARSILELAGIREVNAKILSGSKNPLNIAKATVKALSLLAGAEKVPN